MTPAAASACRRTWPAAILLIGACAFTIRGAKAQPLPALEASPPVVGADKTITLTLPANLASGGNSFRIGLYESSRPTKIAEVKKKFTQQNGHWTATVQLDGDPGCYDFRILGEDKARSALSAPATVTVPGMVREPGWWLPNGSPFIELPRKDDQPAPADAPLFVPGLKRDGKKFDRRVWISPAPLNWRVVDAPLLDSDFEENKWKSEFQKRLNDVRASDERELLGVVVEQDDTNYDQNSFSANARAAKRIVSELAPEAAVILLIRRRPPLPLSVERAVDIWSTLCDAIALQCSPAYGSDFYWATKILRRSAEEQPNYDLPLLLLEENSGSDIGGPVGIHRAFDSGMGHLPYFFMGGMTGVVPTGSQQWQGIIEKNAALFYGSVTLEDCGLVPSSSHSNSLIALNLLDIGRIPLRARIQQKDGKKIPESFLYFSDPSIDAATVEKLYVAARDGARIYIEGSPEIKGDSKRWEDLVGAQSTRLAESINTTMTLEDIWLFGTGSGTQLPVIQSVKVGKLNPPKVVHGKSDEPEKGKDTLVEPRVEARYADGTPALIENPVEDGSVLWAPSDISFPRNSNGSAASKSWRWSTTRQKYYAAITDHFGSALVRVRNRGKALITINTAIRRSPKGTWIIGLFNQKNETAEITLEANHFAGTAVNLADDKELPVTVRGNRSFIDLTIPANGWKLIALGETMRDLDEERFAPQSKARLK